MTLQFTALARDCAVILFVKLSFVQMYILLLVLE